MAKPEYYTEQDRVVFNTLNRETVDRLRRQGDIKLPPKKLDIPKDKKWNTKILNSMLLQGIENGSSMKDIAKSIFPEIMSKSNPLEAGIIHKNEVSAIRNARTMVTNAENQGRLDSYEDLAEKGVVMKKVWIATPDDRTRASHLEIDGEEVDIDEKFSNGCECPGDPNGPPEEVWNCRCSMRSHIIGFRKKDGSIREVNYKRDETMHKEQMQEEKERRMAQAGVQANDLSFADRIRNIAKDIEEHGLTTEHVMEAGKIMQEEVNSDLAERAELLKNAQKEYKDAKDEFEKYQQQLRDIDDDAKYKEAKMIRRGFIDADESKYFSSNEEALSYAKMVDVKRNAIQYSEAYSKAENAVRDAKNALYEAEKIAKGNIDDNVKMLKEKLAEVRPMGSAGIDVKGHLNNSRSPARKNVEYAYDAYPTSWVQASVDMNNLSVKSVQRGYYSDFMQEIAISGYNEGSKNTTAIHEVAHRFERAVKGIREQEKVFYERRTKGEALQWLGTGYAKSEVTRKDDFLSSYMGKDYGGDAYELVSMGFQYAFTEPLTLMKDADMQQWCLGLLAVCP